MRAGEPAVRGPREDVTLQLRDADTGSPLELRPELVVAGYTGRDPRAVEAHLAELEAHGIARPASVPMFYPLPARLLARSGVPVATRGHTSGEVEPVLVVTPEGWWVGVGSDHTDRDVERTDIAASKRACPKVLSNEVLRYERLRDRWDEVVLRSWADGVLYQEGCLADIRTPWEILELLAQALGGLPSTLVVFMGTVPLRGDRFVDAREFSAELMGPVGGPRLTVGYQVERQTGGSR